MNNGIYAITDLDFDFKLWKNHAQYLNIESQLYINRIEELKTLPLKQSTKEILEELQIGFHHLDQDVRELFSSIVIQEDEMSVYARDYPITEEHQHYKDYEALKAMYRVSYLNAIELRDAFEEITA